MRWISHGHQLQTRGAADVLRDRAVQEIGDVDLAALEGGGAGRLIGDALEHDALHAGTFRQ